MTTRTPRLTRPNDRVDLIVERETGSFDVDYARRLIYENPHLAATLILEAGIEYDPVESSAS